MKNYEEMAQSVLKRRDKEVKRRRRAFLIGAPCAAALVVGAVGITAAAVSQSRRYINPYIGEPGEDGEFIFQDFRYDAETALASSQAADNAAEIAETIVGIDIAPEDWSPTIDYPNTNPNYWQTEINVIPTSILYDDDQELDENDFCEVSLEGLDSFYGLRFNRLGELHPDWMFSYDKLGTYRREKNDGIVASLEMYCTRNTLNYTTENGGKVSVSAQYLPFPPACLIHLPFQPADNKPGYTPEVNYEYDEDGNIIGASVGAYDPAASAAPAPAAGEQETNTDNGFVSIINGYNAVVLSDPNVGFLADIEMNTHVRIIASGLTEEEFIQVLDEFTM